MKEKIIDAIKGIFNEWGFAPLSYKFETPPNSQHGDISINVALTAFVQMGQLREKFKSARELAEEIVKLLTTNYKLQTTFDKVEVAGPGFINFFLSKKQLTNNLNLIIQNEEKFGSGDLFENKKVMLEFGDPNPFKEFHIGHLYTTIIGESLSRLQESQGASVWRVCYQGDVGVHVAKAIWGLIWIRENRHEDMQLWKVKSLPAKALLLGEAYARGSMAYEENESEKQTIDDLNKKIYERADPEINELYDAGRAWSLEYFDTIYKRLGTHYEKHYFESEVGKIGLELVRQYVGKVFEEDAGAVIFPGKTYGLHNRVFINSLGLPTYEAKELGLAGDKYKDFPYDLSVIITGNEINEYFKVLLKVLSLINPDLAAKTKHLGHGMVRLPAGKMSSRTGNVVTGQWLLDTAKAKIQEAYPDMDGQTSEKVAVGAVKYALLKSNIGNDIAFSFEESISLEGNSGPYLQYTHARTRSVLAKVQSSKFKVQSDWKFEIEEEALLRHLVHFPEVVADAAEKFAPNAVCTYLFDLAQKFNLFYQKYSILEGGRKKEFRLALTAAVGQTLKNGLNVLGIEAPEKM